MNFEGNLGYIENKHTNDHNKSIPQTKALTDNPSIIISDAQFNCDKCHFSNNVEDNILYHKITMHSTHICGKCDYITNSQPGLT